jgi:hypothetical protein
MGRHRESIRRNTKAAGPPPIWRGIGCLLIVLVPIISFAAADLSLPFFRAQGMVPRELLTTPQPPEWLGILPVLESAYWFVFGKQGILAILVLTIIYTIFLGGILSVLYAFMYQMTTPSRYGPMDAPPPRVKVKKYKR